MNFTDLFGMVTLAEFLQISRNAQENYLFLRIWGEGVEVNSRSLGRDGHRERKKKT